MAKKPEPNLFRALFRHYRQGRGMSQLDLSLAAGVSARHISFVETGRAQPSREVILRLSGALGLNLRDVNALLHAAGLPREFRESELDVKWPDAIERAVTRMLAQQEPYPMIVLNLRHDVLRGNQAAFRLLGHFVEDPQALGARPNLLHAIFDPRLMRSSITDWPRLARTMLTRLQREALARPADGSIPALIAELCNLPGVPEHWREPALDLPATPTLEFEAARGADRVRFLTTLTVFNSALDVTLEEVQLESFFPVDEQTEALCRKLAS
ncbi:MAG TPA: helix-turn-helix transcriptional regulator [Polyangiales bacterium]|nr:helix-turn-helix transcriptional regulator [Polyangiales bacterium]